MSEMSIIDSFFLNLSLCKSWLFLPYYFFSLLAISASTECASLNKGDENYVDPRRLKVNLKTLEGKNPENGFRL